MSLTNTELLEAIERLDKLVSTPPPPAYPGGCVPFRSQTLQSTLDALLAELAFRAIGEIPPTLRAFVGPK